jgi:integrase
MRGKGEGSVYKRASDGLWVGTLELPPKDGKRRRRVVTAKTKTALMVKLKGTREEVAAGRLPGRSQTVEQWMTYWLEKVIVDQVRPTTFQTYRSTVESKIIPSIGTVRLDRLSGEHIRRVLDEHKAAGLSSTTALATYRVMSKALKDAVREGALRSNPAEMVAPPRRAAKQLTALTREETLQFIQAVSEGPDRYLWVTYMLTAARRSEILGLTWDRVTDVLDLSWQIVRLKSGAEIPPDYEHHHIQGGLYFARPKSRTGWRVIPLVDPLKSIIDRWRPLSVPNEWNLVFTRPDGRPLDPGKVSNAWPKARAAAGIDKPIRLHDLRHGVADVLYEAHVDEHLITALMGHSSRVMSRSYRTRTDRAQLTDAMQRMSALLMAGTEEGAE